MIMSILGTLGAVILSVVLVRVTWNWWPRWYNPVMLGVFAWTPALVMSNWPQFFISPLYIHQNRPLSFEVFIALGIAFLAFWAGCAATRALSRREAYAIDLDRLKVHFDARRMLALFAVGVGIFIYSYLSSGLIGLADMDDQQIAASRISLHLGPISFLQIMMDIAAIAFYARFLQSGRWLYAIPIVIAILCYGATLQKSLIVWIATAAILVSALNASAFYDLLLKRAVTKVMLVVAAVGMIVLLAATNTARGITASTMTAASNPFLEQLYIYSGATAIKNLSVTLEGYLPTDDPTYGLFLARPLLWSFVDRSIFESGRYFEGINAATYLNVAWIDFRWAGFAITPFLTGVLVMLFIRFALSGRLAGLVFGAVATRAVIFSIGTDVMFEPVTWYTLILALVADFLTHHRAGRLRDARRGSGAGMKRDSDYPPPSGRRPGGWPRSI